MDAVRSIPWEGVANLEVAVVHLHKGDWHGKRTLDGREVACITPMLDDGTAGSTQPFRLQANENLSFIGSYVLGLGFVMTPEEASALISREPRNADCLFPYLNGEDLNSRPDQSPSRWVINFFDWPLERVPRNEWEQGDDLQRREWERVGRVSPDYARAVAADYPDLLAIVRAKVKPERDVVKRDAHRVRWWIYADKRPGLYRAIANLPRALGACIVTKHVNFCLLDTRQVFSHRLAIVVSPSPVVLAILNSSVHEPWARAYSSTLEARLNYSPDDCFTTFPFPQAAGELGRVGKIYEEHRRDLCIRRGVGLTKLYNLLHDPRTERDSDAVQRQPPPFDDIRRLRALHVEMDCAVLAAYQWKDLDPRHAFYTGRDAGPGLPDDEARFTIHPEVRSEILRRLLALNHQRAAEEKERLERGEEIPSAFSAFEVPSVVVALPAPEKDAVVLPFRRVRPRREDRYKTCVPMLSLKAAAGGFSDEQSVEFEDWVEIQTSRKLRKGMFVAQVVGHSMEPRIPDGSYCLFSYPVVGTRQGRIVLAQHRDIQDPDTHGAYTLKVYESEKVADEDGGWRHSKIILRPINPAYRPIVLKDIEEGEVAVIAEFVEVLEAQATEAVAITSPDEFDISVLAAQDAGAWATPAGVTEENLALFAALDVLRALGKDSDPQRVRLAAILVRRPVLALPFMTGPMRDAWIRAVGPEAKPLPANVIPIDRFQKDAADAAWGKAVLRLKATGNLAEDKSTGRWSPKAQLPASGQAWVEGRARVVASLLREIELAKAEQNLVAFVKDIEDGAAGQAVS